MHLSTIRTGPGALTRTGMLMLAATIIVTTTPAAESTKLTITVSRSAGVANVSLTRGDDTLTLTVPEVLLTDERAQGVGRLTVNGRSAQLSRSELRQLQAISQGTLDPDAASVSLETRRLADHIGDGAGLAEALSAFGSSLARTRGSLVEDDCTVECASCTLGSGAYVTSWSLIVVASCVTTVGCLLLGAAHATAVISLGIGCGQCIACLATPPESGHPVHCPPICDLIACPQGCPCPDGTPAGPQGCECDPDSDPDGCACPAGLSCVAL